MIAVNKQYRINKAATRRIVNESKTPCGVVFLFETSQKDNVMNIWTQKSIELATQRNYLNLLYRVYPMSVNLRRELSKSTLNNIKIAFDSRDGNSLLKILLKQEMFPIKDINKYEFTNSMNSLRIDILHFNSRQFILKPLL